MGPPSAAAGRGLFRVHDEGSEHIGRRGAGVRARDPRGGTGAALGRARAHSHRDGLWHRRRRVGGPPVGGPVRGRRVGAAGERMPGTRAAKRLPQDIRSQAKGPGADRPLAGRRRRGPRRVRGLARSAYAGAREVAVARGAHPHSPCERRGPAVHARRGRDGRAEGLRLAGGRRAHRRLWLPARGHERQRARPSRPTSFSEVERRILEGVDIAIDAGETRCKDASTIVALPSGNLKIVRQGALPAKAIASAVASCEGPSAPSSTER